MRQTVKRMPPPTGAQILAVKKGLQLYVAAVRQDWCRRHGQLSVEERGRRLDAGREGGTP